MCVFHHSDAASGQKPDANGRFRPFHVSTGSVIICRADVIVAAGGGGFLAFRIPLSTLHAETRNYLVSVFISLSSALCIFLASLVILKEHNPQVGCLRPAHQEPERVC
jgi:hypothetical protein